MKFLYVGDLHQDELVPIHRIDNFNETRREKIFEILQIAKDNKVNAILHGGDFFNRPKMSNEFVTSIIETWNNKLIPIDIQDLTFQFQAGNISENEYLKEINKYKENNIPFISIIGNHDLIGDNIESYPKTSLNVLETSGFLHIVDKDNPIIFKEKDISVAITGYHYNRELDKSTDKKGYIVDEKVQIDGKNVDYQIHITHGMLTSKSYGKKFAHTVINDIQNLTVADLTINGHDHIGFDTIFYNNKIFANPGSPFRLSADKKEIARMPKVMLINIDNNGITLQDIYLKCAKKGDIVLSEDAKIIAKNKQSTMAKIQTMINQSSMQKGLRIADIIDNIGGASNIDKDILLEVQNKIIESMNLLQPSYSPSGEYYITRLELENFLSHKNSTFDFKPGLNILSGESRSGKSAVLRALREVLTCYITQPRDAIFFGASYFAITVYTNNGYIITRRVEKDEKKGFNGYEIYDPKTGVSTKYNTKAVNIVQEILGYSKIPLTEKKSIDINSVIQGDGWFYIGNNITAPDRARLLGVVYGTHYADAANKNIIADIKKTNTQINLIQQEKDRLESKKNDFAYIFNLKKDIDEAEILLNELEKKEIDLKKIKELIHTFEYLKTEISKLTYVKKVLDIEFKPYLIALKEQSNILNIAKEKYNNMINIVNQGKTFRPLQSSLKNINLIRNDFIELKNKELVLNNQKEKYQTYINLQKKETIIINEKDILNKVNKSLKDIKNIKSISKNLKKQEIDLIKFKEDANKTLYLKTQLDNFSKNIIENKNILSRLEELPKINDIKVLKQNEILLKQSKDLFNKLQNLVKENQEENKKLEEIKQQNLNYINIYREQLERLGTCPICHSNIDSKLVNHLVSSHIAKIE